MENCFHDDKFITTLSEINTGLERHRIILLMLCIKIQSFVFETYSLERGAVVPSAPTIK